MTRSRLSWAALGLLTGLSLGCTKTEPPAFRANDVALAAAEMPRGQQQVIADVLFALYGTPDEPVIPAESGLNLTNIKKASGPVRSDTDGQSRGLYRQHCAHCHGTTGDGMGPTAAILNPYPRDYRRGIYKFKSTERAAPPTDADLERIVRQGVMGTAMPSFDLLPNDEISALVEYVKYLSMRGQTEERLIAEISDMGSDQWRELAQKAGVWDRVLKQLGAKEGDEIDETKLVQAVLTPVNLGQIETLFCTEHVVGSDKIIAGLAESWKGAAERVVQPPEKPEMSLEDSIAKGRELFYGAAAQCVKCHGPSALGDGQTNDYDDWSKPIVEYKKRVEDSRKSIAADKDLSSDERKTRLAAVNALAAALEHDSLEPRNIIPRNLRTGYYRGGRRPLDLYRRVQQGIYGAPMPAAAASIKPEELWHIVDYIRSLPYESIGAPPKQQQFTGRAQL